MSANVTILRFEFNKKMDDWDMDEKLTCSNKNNNAYNDKKLTTWI